VRAGLTNDFKLVAGSPKTLLGWHRHDELYEAFRHPERKNAELIADIRSFNERTKRLADRLDLGMLFVSLGDYDSISSSTQYWDAALAGYRRSPQFKAQMRKTGVYDYWRKHGFPPQCRPLAADEFECK
jgi:hypothetical protein